MTRSWTFAEDEGGATVVEADDDELVIHVYTGPDCDLTTTERHYEFVKTDDPLMNGARTSSGPMRWDTTFIHALNPRDAYLDQIWFELGSNLWTKPLLRQEEEL